MMQSMNQSADLDLLVCGSCQRNFPLGNIVTFMQHKKFDCAEYELAEAETLACQSCPRQFETPWSLLKHAQNVHALKIYLERGPFSAGIASVNFLPEFGDNNSSSSVITEYMIPASKRSRTPTGHDHYTDTTSALTVVRTSPTHDSSAVVVTCGRLDDGKVVNLLDDCNTCSTTVDTEMLQQQVVKSLKTDKKLDLGAVPTSKSIETTSLKTKCDGPTEMIADDTESTGNRPVVMEKCCSSIVPKKRKRHMEIKHGGAGGRKRTIAVSNAPTSIYIDLEPTGEGQGFRASVSHGDDRETSQMPHESPDFKFRSGMYRHSVIIQPGTTFSIPVSYSGMTSSQPTSSYVAASHSENDSVTCVESTSGEQSATLQQTDTDQKVTEFIVGPSGAMQLFHLTGTEAGQDAGDHGYDVDASSQPGYETFVYELPSDDAAKCQDQRRRRYPTSRPFKCDQCNDAFNQRIHLKKHQSKHTGVKPYKCDHCDYSTVERSHLKVHIRVHTGEKPYKCTYCEYATAQNSTLKIHLKRHHCTTPGATGADTKVPTDLFVCSACGQHFEQRDKFTTHAVTVHSTSGAELSPDGTTTIQAPDGTTTIQAPDGQASGQIGAGDQEHLS